MLKDFMTFDKMISPILIKIIFWIGVIFSVLIGAFWTLSGLSLLLFGHSLFGLVIAIGALMGMAFGILWSRIVCEILIVVFLIHDDLAVIRKGIAASQPNVGAYAPAYAPTYAPPVMPQTGIQQANIPS